MGRPLKCWRALPLGLIYEEVLLWSPGFGGGDWACTSTKTGGFRSVSQVVE